MAKTRTVTLTKNNEYMANVTIKIKSSWRTVSLDEAAPCFVCHDMIYTNAIRFFAGEWPVGSLLCKPCYESYFKDTNGDTEKE